VVRAGGVVSYVPSACLLGRVAALRDGLGGFDESMRAGEDVDLVWRLGRVGWTVRYAPEAQVRHDHRTRPGPWLRRKAFYGTSAAPLAARHGDAVAPLVVAPWSAAFALALLAQRRWSAPVAVATAALAIRGAARQLKRSDHPLRAAATLVLEGAVATLWQTAAALTRHYWPAAAAVALVSRRARRALVAAAVGEAVAAWWRIRPDLDPVRYLVAHRLDDAAYGLWLWAGALRARSVAALTPAWRGFGRR
jgi:mycofactocin system glycosyltransferase